MYLELGDMDFFLPTRTHFGWGRTKEIPGICNNYGKRCLLVTMKDIPHGKRVFELLDDAGFDITYFDGCEPEPSVEGIDGAWQTLETETYDFMVSVGGGSVIDTTKAFRVLNASGGNIWEYTVEMADEKRPVPPDLIPQIAVPTTSGTGAEVTQVAVVTNRSLQKKGPVVNPEIYPTVSVIDPELTMSMPQHVTASTGFDAFTHAHECFFSNMTLSPLASQLSIAGMKLVVDNLERLLAEPDNRDLRTLLSWAATQNGLLLGAIALQGGSGVHIFSLPFGAISGLAHGVALAVTVGPVTRFQLGRKPFRARAFGEVFGLDTKHLNGPDLEKRVLEAMASWLDRIGMITSLGGHGIGSDMIDSYLQSVSVLRIKNSIDPKFTTADMRKIYEECL